jgi:hypothetical protein
MVVVTGELNMRRKLLTATLFAATMAPGGQAGEPAPEKQVAALSEQHRLAAIKGDTKVLDAVLADDWVVVGPTGVVETKRQQEKTIKDKMNTLPITGCSSGFGFENARHFLERRWKVIASSSPCRSPQRPRPAPPPT